MARAIVLPKRIAERIEREARNLGISLEEYVLEILSRDLDPRDRARDYIDAARELVKQTQEELERGDVRRATEKLWGAAALAIKAYAGWREGRRLVSHRELWEYKDRVAEELGSWITSAFREANSLHWCFYEGWCTDRDVREVLEVIKKLVELVENRIEAGSD